MTTSSSAAKASIPVFALLLAMLLWASSFIALKIGFRGYDPLVVIFGRMLVASICFLFIFRRIPLALHYRKGDYKLILFMAFCEPCLYFLFEAKAVANTSASQAGVITATCPVLVMCAAAVILKEKVNLRSWTGGAMAMIGVIWLTLASTPSSDAPNPLLGNTLECLAMVCATGYTISLKTLTARYPALLLTACQAFIGCLFYFPLLFLPSTSLPTSTADIQLGPTLAVIYLGSMITMGAYGLYNYGVKHLSANRASNFINLIPLFAVIQAWLLLGERLNLQQVFAALTIMGGVYLTQTSLPATTAPEQLS